MSVILAKILDGQRGHLFPWVPVLYACGVGAYFSLRFEPTGDAWRWICLGLILAWGLLHYGAWSVRPLFWAFLLVLAGVAVAGLKAHRVAEIKLEYRYYGPIEGRVIKVDRSASDAVRLTLDRVRLGRMWPDETPGFVRVALYGDQSHFTAEPGILVGLTGHLSPPGGAVEPGGYDFRRQAWFQGLGAVGYTRTPVVALAPHDGQGVALWIYRLRMQLSAAIQSTLPGPVGGIASALTTGDRSAISEPTYEALRASNLAHLLAISGLHMGLLTGFVFACVRLGLGVAGGLSLRVPSKKIAAVVAMLAGTAYLFMSGGNVATERAFIMVSVMFGAVLVDRRAVTLRAVAIAAMIVLTLKPEALLGPGFQMSFAATTALVAVYGMFRQHGLAPHRWPRWMRVVGGVALSSLIAGLATAPIGAAHFNRVPHYGLVANVLSVPLMGAVIIPGAVLAALLAPFGLGFVGLELMAPAIRWILWVAATVSEWPGSVSHVIAPSGMVLPLLALGGLWWILWQGLARHAGAVIMVAALWGWGQTERPDLLVAASGGLVGVMTDDGRALSKPRGDGFSAKSWLENDGDPAEQAVAATRVAYQVDGRIRAFDLGKARIVHATGKVASRVALGDCQAATLLISNAYLDAPAGCQVYDAKRLAGSGTLAIYATQDGLRVVSAAELAGRRLWSQ